MKASLRALLTGTVDYAGLFPPANLELEPALKNHAAYVRSDDAWMLGAFILPIAKFDAALDLSPFDVQHRLHISALCARTEHAAEFRAALAEAAEAIRNFNSKHGAIASISQIEVPIAAQPGATIGDTAELLGDLQVPIFLEAVPDDAERTIAELAEHRQATGIANLGFKLRTGGVVASAFPSSIQIARALVAAVTRQVPIKFTAGLHHPMRHFHPSVQAKMHGFINVFGAGVLAAERRWDPVQTAAMLEDEDETAFSFSDDLMTWREWQITTERIAVHRALVTSFGSCSFDEPRDDLRALNLF